jgi:DNA-binding NtrC family response regulator
VTSGNKAGLPKGHILIVDDDQEMLDTMTEYFSDSMIVEKAMTDYEAWHILKTKNIDCVFCDIKLGSKSGLELLKKCKDNDINTPFVIISGFVDKEKLINAIRIGAIDVLEKPLDLNYLNKQIHSFIESGRSIQKIKKDLDSIVSAVSPADDKSMQFVEDYLLHSQMYKQRKAS